MHDSPLTPDEESELHRRLLANDPTASSDLAVAFLNALIRWVRGTNPRIDDDLRVQAAEDAIISLIKAPHTFQSGKSLWKYLCMSSKGDLKNALAAERRRQRHLVRLDSVEVDPSNGKYDQGKPGDVTLLHAEELEQAQRRILPGVTRNLSEEECRALDLILAGERRTEAFASVLGITSEPLAKQREIVKRLKDKLNSRLKRCREEI